MSLYHSYIWDVRGGNQNKNSNKKSSHVDRRARHTHIAPPRSLAHSSAIVCAFVRMERRGWSSHRNRVQTARQLTTFDWKLLTYVRLSFRYELHSTLYFIFCASSVLQRSLYSFFVRRRKKIPFCLQISNRSLVKSVIGVALFFSTMKIEWFICTFRSVVELDAVPKKSYLYAAVW